MQTMDDDQDPRPATTAADRSRRTSARRGRSAALVAGGLLAGGLLAGAASASAATNATSPATTSGTGTAASGYGAAPAGGIGGSGPVRSDEKAVTGTNADRLRAAALKAVPGGTVVRIETDAGDAAYEVHMTKADGTVVTVKFDDSLALVRVEDGMGRGDPAPAGASGGTRGSTAPATPGA